jgi:hypothetical protein
MMDVLDLLASVLIRNGLITAFLFVGVIVWISYFVSGKLTGGRLHGSAIAILVGLVLAYVGGVATGGSQGLADIEILAGVGLLGGAMLRDFAIVATAFGVHFDEIKKAGAGAIVSLFAGVLGSFMVGAIVAYLFGYTDPISMTAIGATSDVVALSIAAGLVKSMLVMTGTPFVARYIGLNNPRSALVYGGLMGTTSGVAGGLAATDPKLVPYGAMTATFYTGLGCLLGPSVVFFTIRGLFG